MRLLRTKGRQQQLLSSIGIQDDDDDFVCELIGVQVFPLGNIYFA